ncbi:DNA-binding NarL/FixJ family response regulator [Nocardiopsis mwathae]|uniref:DNA-binding NarL/FixJ family response regulator n=1 Tax=Nocardiopsis mwathae TaxID=1472723 RepID=A0A7W9YPB0_9ACTN|nr:response regulator transcription factor [Nocardiopsis mwathae]MBB6175186.1 DNA-binding NarL/FixJ family response regulator [Nocardiopsis mwathae]
MRVLIVEPQTIVRASISALLAELPGIVLADATGAGTDVVALARRSGADVVLMNADVEDADGFALTRALRSDSGGRTDVVLRLSTTRVHEVQYALDAGASGILTRDSCPDVMADALDCVAKGRIFLESDTIRHLVTAAVAVPPRARISEDPCLSPLTDRELQILRLVARALNNRQIAAHLMISEGTVKAHLSRVLGKLRLTSRTQAVVFAYDCGLVTPHPRSRESA